jgi:hypothetical protein
MTLSSEMSNWKARTLQRKHRTKKVIKRAQKTNKVITVIIMIMILGDSYMHRLRFEQVDWVSVHSSSE